MIKRTCRECQIEFYVYPCRSKIRRGIFCSKKCLGISQRKALIERCCVGCGKRFLVRQWQIKENRGICCSRECANSINKGCPINPELDATMEPTREDIIGAAFFYEGEGSISIHNKKNMQVSVTQKDIEPLVWLKQRWGGNIYSDRNISRWQTGGKRAKIFMESILPWLFSRRREQYQKVLNGLGNK